MQMLTGAMKLTLAAILVDLIVVECLKESNAHRKGRFFVLNRAFFIFRIAFAAAMLILVNYFFGAWLWRLAVALRTNKTWTRRKRIPVIWAAWRACTLNVIIICYATCGIAILARPSYFCRMPAFLTAVLAAGWMAVNVMLLLLVIGGHGPVPAEVYFSALDATS